MHRSTPLWLAVLPALLLLACDGSGSGGTTGINQPASFTATVTGFTSASLSGLAAASGGAATSGWGIAMGPGNEQSITFLTPGRDRPDVGTYSISTFGQGEGEFVVSVTLGGGVSSYNGVSGTITLTFSSATRVQGTFNFAATRGTVANPQNINVQGSFNAVNQ